MKLPIKKESILIEFIKEKGTTMKKTSLFFTLVGCLLFGCGPATSTQPETQTPTTAGPEASQSEQTIANSLGNVTLKDVDGKNVSLAEYASGKTVIISFFATFCEPCKQKTIDHQLLYDKFKDKGFAVIAISVDEPETSGDVRPFVKSRNLTFPVLLDTDFEGCNQLNPRRTLPYSIIMDRRGKIVWTHEGYVPGDDKLIEDHVAEAIANDTLPSGS